MMQNIFILLSLINKRLFKDKVFICMLIMVPILGIILSAVEKSDSADIFRIGMVINESEPELDAIISDFTKENEAYKFLNFPTKDEAMESLAAGDVDAVIVFPEGFVNNIQKMAMKGKIKSALELYVPEETTITALIKEKLSATIFPLYSQYFFEGFCVNDCEIDISSEEVAAYIDEKEFNGNLFEMRYPDFEKPDDVGLSNFFLRGMLSVWILICVYVGGVFYYEDLKKGVFFRKKTSHIKFMPLFYRLVIGIDVLIVSLLTIYLAGINTDFGTEIISGLLFMLCSIGFTSILGLFLKNTKVLLSFLPGLLVLLLLLCPVFIDFKQMRAIQVMLPPFFYLKSIHNVYYIRLMCLYAAISLAIGIIGNWGKKYEAF